MMWEKEKRIMIADFHIFCKEILQKGRKEMKILHPDHISAYLDAAEQRGADGNGDESDSD